MCIRDSNNRSENNILVKKNLQKSLHGTNVSDILIMRNWLSYALKVGDLSYNKIFEKIDSESIQYAESISETTAPISLALAKRLVNSGMDTSLDTGLEMESFERIIVFKIETTIPNNIS